MTYEEKATLIANAHWQGGAKKAGAVLREAVAEETTLLCATLADIRIATGVNEKPMLGELAGAIKARMDAHAKAYSNAASALVTIEAGRVSEPCAAAVAKVALGQCGEIVHDR